MNTQDGYDWPNHHPEAPDLLACTGDGEWVILRKPGERLVESGMTFRGVPILLDARFVEKSRP